MSFSLAQLHLLRPAWLLAIIPLLLLLILLWRRHSRQSGWRAVVAPSLLPYLLDDTVTRRRRWPLLALLIGGVLASIAMAGPAWERLPQPVFRNDAALVLVLDLSRSMDAQDVKPSRLQRARFKIADILNARREGQVALIVYAADAFTVTPLSDDDNTILLQLPALTTALPPAQGSRADKALQMATRLLQQASQTQGQILLITDEAQPARGIEAAQKVHQAGHRLSILGVGTVDGAPVPASGGMLSDAGGALIMAKLNAANLQRIAAAGGGRYATLSADDADIRHLDIVDASAAAVDDEADDRYADRWREAGPWLLLPLLLLAPLAFRRGVLALACLCALPLLSPPAQAFEWRDLWRTADQRAQQLLQQNKPAEAAKHFQRPAWRASANYRAGNYQQALEDFQSIEGADARYNEGNTLARMGKLPEAIEAYNQAIELQPEHEDAIHNRQLVEEQLQQQQAQQGQNQQGQEQQGQQQQGQDQQGQQQQAQQRQQEQQDQAAQNAAQEQESAEEESAMQQANKDDTDDAEQDGEQLLQSAKDAEAAAIQEAKISQEQWLKRIPDDPAGLLKRKFKYQYQRQPARSGDQSW